MIRAVSQSLVLKVNILSEWTVMVCAASRQ